MTCPTSKSAVPGPQPSDPELGNLPDVGRAGSLHEYLVELHTKYGPIVSFYWEKLWVVSIGKASLFKQHLKLFNRPVPLFKLYEPFIGRRAIQYANDEDGKQRRLHYDTSFSHKKMEFYLPMVAQFGNELCEKWKMASDAKQSVQCEMDCFTTSMKSMLNCAFGEVTAQELPELKVAYETMFAEMEYRLTHGPAPEDNPRTVAFNEARVLFNNAIKKLVQARVSSQPTDTEELFIDRLIEMWSEDEETLYSDALCYFTAGFHTTGYSITWALYFLARSLHCQHALQRELDEAVESGILSHDGAQSMEAIAKLPYLRRVIDEALRCSILAPWAARYVDSDSTLGGYPIPATTPVIHALGVTLCDPAVYPEPEKFDPDRFLNRKDPLTFEPFGFAGKRKCPGYRFSYMELSIWLIQIFQRFNVRLADEAIDVKRVYGLVTKPSEKFELLIEPRSTCPK